MPANMEPQEPKEYTIDGRPVSWLELIDAASNLRAVHFRDPSFKTTSEAAGMLRRAGHIIGYANQEIKIKGEA